MDLVVTHNQKVTTTSILVAEKFGKRHDDVLRAIRNIVCSDDFRLRNFTERRYLVRGKYFPMFNLTRDAFTILVMSFSGPTAAKFREEFIEEFNRMEALLRLPGTPRLIPTYQNRILSEPTKAVPKGYWSIFDESHSVMLFVEKNIGSVNQFDLVDGSIGKRWNMFREGKPWVMPCSKYPHEYTDVRGTRECKCYEYGELPFFREWLKGTYKTIHLYDYLHGKYSKEKNRLMLDKVEGILPKLLKAS